MKHSGEMSFIATDGGRAEAGFKGVAGDCVARAIAIASARPYSEVYKALAAGNGSQRNTKKAGKQEVSARNGIYTSRKWFKDYMISLGFKWVPTMFVGRGCKVHLRAGELPRGRLVVSVSKHYTAVIDGVIHDTHDPSRTTTSDDGSLSYRCVIVYRCYADPMYVSSCSVLMMPGTCDDELE